MSGEERVPSGGKRPSESGVRDVRVQRTKNGWLQVVTEQGVVDSFRGMCASDKAAKRAADLGRVASVLDRYLPLRGPCGICGVPGMDQTHRVIDSIADMARAHLGLGDLDVSWVAEEFGFTEGDGDLVNACLAWTATKGSDHA